MVGGTLQERLYIRPNDNIWCKIINDSCLLLACTVVIRSLLKHKYRMFTCISIWWDLPSRLGAHAEIKGPMLKMEFLHLRFSTLTTDCVHFWCAHPAESYYYIVENNTSIISTEQYNIQQQFNNLLLHWNPTEFFSQFSSMSWGRKNEPLFFYE